MKRMMTAWLLTGLATLLSLSFASLGAGDRATDEGDYRSAITAYEAALAENAESAEALYKLARAKTYLAESLSGDEAEALYEAAATHARAATDLAPDDPEAHMEVARALGRLAQFQGVLESLNLAAEVHDELERVLELDPEHGGALHALALWNLEVPWIAGGRSAQVRPLFDRAIAAEPDIIAHYLDYAEALVRLEDAAAARAQLEKAVTLEPQDVREEENLREAQEMLSGL